MNHGATGKLLAFASVVEFGTGIAVILVPALVVNLLVGLQIAADGTLLARCFGIALLGLSFACWPGKGIDGSAAAFRGMLIYNASISIYLTYLGVFEHMYGLLLWPGVVLHAIVAILLVLAVRKN